MLHTLLPDLISHYVAAGWFVYAYQSIKFPVLCPYPRCFQLPFMTGLLHCFMETGYSHIQWFHHIFKTLTMTMSINFVWYFTGVLLVPSVTYWLSLAFKLATGLGLLSKLKPMKKPLFYQLQFWELYFYPSKNAWFSPCSNSKKFSLLYLEKIFKGVCFCPECLSASAILWSVCCRYWNLQNTKSHWIYALSSPFIACMTWHTVAWNKIHKCQNFLPFFISSSPFPNIQQRQYLEMCHLDISFKPLRVKINCVRKEESPQ